MKKKFMKYTVGLAFFSLACLTSCDDDKDLGGKMEEIITISSITIDDTEYDADNKTICLLKNKELQLSWVITPVGATDTDLQWTSSDETVAQVTPEGKIITQDKAGTAVLTLMPKIGFGPEAAIVTRKIEVMDEYTYMSSITIKNVPSEEIASGDEYQLEVVSEPLNTTFKRYKWTSSNPEVATVDEKTGLLTGISKGNVTITVTADDFSANPVSEVCNIGVKVVTPITGMTFTQDEELNQLGYGQEYQIKYTLEPENATASLLTWSSDNSDAISVDKTGKLTVHSTKTASAVITASYGPVVQTVTVTVADGRFWYSLGNGLGNGMDNNWYLDGNGASVLSSDGEKTIVQMGSGYRGDLWLARSGKGKIVNLAPGEYRYLAIKVGFKSVLVPGKNKPNGCIKLEVFDDGIKNIGPEYFGNGGDANNRYAILDAEEISTTEPNVLYYDLQSKYKTITPTDWNQIFNLAQCKFVIADFPETAQTYDLYWIRSFKSVEELRAFVAGN